MEPAPETPPPVSASPAASGATVPLLNRFVAALIDGILIAIVGWAIALVVPIPFISTLVTIPLWLVRDSLPFLEGQSPGKKVFGHKAVTESGASLSGNWSVGAMRNITMAIPFVGLVECIVLLVRQGKPEEGRRLGDDIAKTKVVKV